MYYSLYVFQIFHFLKFSHILSLVQYSCFLWTRLSPIFYILKCLFFRICFLFHFCFVWLSISLSLTPIFSLNNLCVFYFPFSSSFLRFHISFFFNFPFFLLCISSYLISIFGLSVFFQNAWFSFHLGLLSIFWFCISWCQLLFHFFFV